MTVRRNATSLSAWFSASTSTVAFFLCSLPSADFSRWHRAFFSVDGTHGSIVHVNVHAGNRLARLRRGNLRRRAHNNPARAFAARRRDRQLERRLLPNESCGAGHQIAVVLQDVTFGHQMKLVGRNAEFLEGRACARPTRILRRMATIISAPFGSVLKGDLGSLCAPAADRPATRSWLLPLQCCRSCRAPLQLHCPENPRRRCPSRCTTARR